MPAKDYGLLALNYVGSLTGLWNNFTRSSSIDPTAADKLTPEQQRAVIKRHQTSNLASLSLDPANIPSATTFETYSKKRISSVDGMPAVQFGGKSIADILKAGAAEPAKQAAATAVSTAITGALAESTALRTAKENFNKTMGQIHETFGAGSTLDFNPRFVLRMLHEQKSDAEKAIKEQQAAEIKNLTDQFANPAFRDNLKTTLGVTGQADADAKVDAVKDDMLAAMKTSHEKELAAFNKSMSEPLKKMHTALQKERDRVFFLATLAAHSDEMQRAIHALHASKSKKGAAGISIQAGVNNPRALFKGIDVRELKTIETATGRKLQLQEDGSYSMDLPNRLYNSSYYHSSHQNMKADFLTMASAVHCNHDSITMSADHNNPKHALKMGRAAYAACLEAGFDPKKITIEVNGKAVSMNELFKDNPSELAATRAQAAKNEKERSKTDEELKDEKGYGEYKAALNKGRDAATRQAAMEELLEKEDAEAAAAAQTRTI